MKYLVEHIPMMCFTAVIIAAIICKVDTGVLTVMLFAYLAATLWGVL